ncbi:MULTISPECIES: hypothetical protein [Kytococcus]|uniref:Uncharacterized protein n=1 Tax=Kytococcus schroeteri TaxID=138300 RepID=A0A2I1P8A1_9MICO|nr:MULTISPECIES: hypothetical protein [Kytococcus]OFS14530.1 hypothetical protein HMPREF3099_04030 [Kytococcus sp. HMSC28H12]PKZ40859.1 hypothetical protein CYJ76_10830 [Kytococcus schroeteri]
MANASAVVPALLVFVLLAAVVVLLVWLIARSTRRSAQFHGVDQPGTSPAPGADEPGPTDRAARRDA